jgi:hypothetical protein
MLKSLGAPFDTSVIRSAVADYSRTGTQGNNSIISLLHLHYPLHGANFVDE